MCKYSYELYVAASLIRKRSWIGASHIDKYLMTDKKRQVGRSLRRRVDLAYMSVAHCRWWL